MESTVRRSSIVVIPSATPASLVPLFAAALVHPALRPRWLEELAGEAAPAATLRLVFAVWHAHLQGLPRLVDAVAAGLPNPALREALRSGLAAARRPHGGGGEPARLVGGICNALHIDIGEDQWGRSVVRGWHDAVLGALAEGVVVRGVGALALGGEGLAVVLQQRLPVVARGLEELPERARQGMARLHRTDDACRRALRAVAGRLAAGFGAALREGMTAALDLQQRAWQRLQRSGLRRVRAA